MQTFYKKLRAFVPATGAGRKFWTHLFLLLCSFCSAYRAHAQIDREFWFVAPDLAQSHGDRPILLRMASFDSGATVVISQPANPSFAPIVTHLTPNTSVSVNLTPWTEQVENKPTGAPANKGLLIQATAPISAYYDIANSLNGDMFSLKGKNALGLAFHVPFQNAWNSNYIGSTINIVATQNDTRVTIIPSKDLKDHKAGEPFDVVLQRGQTYACEAASLAAAGHLDGTLVKADKPIAVTTHDDSMNPGSGGCRDTAGDQLIPDSKAGQDFIVLKGFLDVPDAFYVLAIHNNTLVTVDGRVVDTLDAGQSYRHRLSDPTAYVVASKPVHLFQVSGFGCEVGGAIIPTITCSGSKEVNITRATSQFLSVNIVVPTAITGSFTFNGRSDVITAAHFKPVPASGGAWSYARMELPVSLFAVGSAASIRNSAGKFQLGFIHGDRTSTCRFAYFSAFSERDLLLEMSPTGAACQGGTITLKASSNATQKFVWQGPNGFRASGATIQFSNVQTRLSGWYYASTVGASCMEQTDSVYVKVQGRSVVKQALSFCAGSQLELPNGRLVKKGGEYRDTLRYPSGCDSLVRISQVRELPVPVLSVQKSNDITCEMGRVQLRATGAASYQWWPETGLSNARIANPDARPKANTWYRVTGTAPNGCTTTDSVLVELSLSYAGTGNGVPTAFTPNGDGRNDCFGVRHWGWVENFSLRVFNRWGTVIFETKDVGGCWDGRFESRLQPSEVYVYVIKGRTACGDVSRTGTVVLLK